MRDAEIDALRVELVEFQHGEIGVEVVSVVLSLLLHVFLEVREVIRIVAKSCRLLESERKIYEFHSPFDAFQHFGNGHRCTVIGFDESCHFRF